MTIKEEITLQIVADRIGIEGIGYAIESYYSRNLESTDEKLNKLWEQAYNALKALRNYLPDSDY